MGFSATARCEQQPKTEVLHSHRLGLAAGASVLPCYANMPWQQFERSPAGTVQGNQPWQGPQPLCWSVPIKHISQYQLHQHLFSHRFPYTRRETHQHSHSLCSGQLLSNSCTTILVSSWSSDICPVHTTAIIVFVHSRSTHNFFLCLFRQENSPYHNYIEEIYLFWILFPWLLIMVFNTH